ncbi:MAG TPA: hypothetical protein DDY78_27435 [Planctomycetales bacterium]|nr:hypothetical protein [Planctomycetales bacterium]
MNNMKQIAFAMHAYAEAHNGRLPPAVLRDAQGKPLLSWRVLILPYLEKESLYQQFHLDEPWDSPQNIALLSSMPRVYFAPTELPVDARAELSSTFYQVFTGEETAFEYPQGLRFPQDFSKGTSNVFLVVEAGQAVPWTKPSDVFYDDDEPFPLLGGVFTGESRFSLFGSNRVKGFHAAMADGSVRFFPSTTSEVTLRDAITRSEGQRLKSHW